MTFKAVRYALSIPKLEANDRLLLIMIADRCNVAWQCFPSQAWLAERCGMSVGRVKRGLQSLENMGLVTRRKRSSQNGRTSDEIHIVRPPAKVQNGP